MKERCRTLVEGRWGTTFTLKHCQFLDRPMLFVGGYEDVVGSLQNAIPGDLEYNCK